MLTFLLVLHGIVTLLLIGVILIQKTDNAGGLMSSGSGNVFSARGAANFLTHATAVLAAIFMGNCLLIAYVSSHSNREARSLFIEETEHQHSISSTNKMPVRLPMASSNTSSQEKANPLTTADKKDTKTTH